MSDCCKIIEGSFDPNTRNSIATRPVALLREGGD